MNPRYGHNNNNDNNDDNHNDNNNDNDDFKDERLKGEQDGPIAWKKGDHVLVKLSYCVQLPFGIEVYQSIYIYIYINI